MVGQGETIAILNRWQERYAEYEHYVDHARHDVCYVTTKVGVGSVPSVAAHVELVEHTDDWNEVLGAMERIIERFGEPSRVVALKEDDLLIAARLRELYATPGPTTQQLLPFRDKLSMTHLVRQRGLPAPAVGAVSSRSDVLDFAKSHGWPLVFKPRLGSSSQGVVIVKSPTSLNDQGNSIYGMDRLVQAFDSRPIYHVDGIFDGRKIVFGRPSRYLNSCLGFREGAPLGSVEVDDPGLTERILEASTEFLSALTAAPTPFHLELFVDDSSCGFLEAGARVGGSEIPILWREIHGIDMMRIAFDLQMGLALSITETKEASGLTGGWLLIPAPTSRPCLVTRSTSLLADVEPLYAQVTLEAGDVLPNAEAYYEHVGGRFRFKGESAAIVADAIVRVADQFEIDAVAIETSSSVGVGTEGARATHSTN